MKFLLYSLLFFIGSSFQMLAQEANVYDPNAKKLLDEISASTKGMEPVKVEFSYLLDNRATKVKETSQGNIVIEGAKYVLNLGKIQMFCDGKAVYTYLSQNDEMQINNISTENDALNPSTIFTAYQKGFKYSLKKDEVINGTTYQVVELYPENLKKKYAKVQILVNKSKKQIYSFKTFGKDGTNYEIVVKSISQKVKTDPKFFTVDMAKFPTAEVVDLRE